MRLTGEAGYDIEAERTRFDLSSHRLAVHAAAPCPPWLKLAWFERIGAPPAIAQVIDKALLKNRDQRYQTIDDLANAIREICGDPLVDPKSRNTSSQTAVSCLR